MGKNVSTMNDVNEDCVANPPVVLNANLGVDEALKLVSNKEDSHHVSLSISCKELINIEKREGTKVLKTNPFVCVYLSENNQTTWEYLGITEIINNELNPLFVKRVNLIYKVELVQYLRFEVYDRITDVRSNTIPDPRQQAFIGEFTLQLNELMGSFNRTINGTLVLPSARHAANNKSNVGARGLIQVYGSKITLEQNLALIKLQPTNFPVGQYYLYVHTVHTSADRTEVYHPLYRSELQDQNQSWNLVRIAYCYFYSPPVESYLGSLGRAVSSFGTTSFISPLKKAKTTQTDDLPATPDTPATPPPAAAALTAQSPQRPATLTSSSSFFITESHVNTPKIAFEVKQMRNDGILESVAIAVCNVSDLATSLHLDFNRAAPTPRSTTPPPRVAKTASFFGKSSKNVEALPAGTKTLVISAFEKTRVPTFMEYLLSGVKINMLVAVDCSETNRPFNEPESLHHIHPDCDLSIINKIEADVPDERYQEQFRRLNPYQQAICSIGDIIETYDDDRLFPVLGFGGFNNAHTRAQQYLYFDANGLPSLGRAGILNLYNDTISTVTFARRNVSKLLVHINTLAEEKQREPELNYFVAFIITNGSPEDLDEAKKKVVLATTLPISLIFIGVGTNGDFTGLRILDGDEVRLTDSGNRNALRDIVQFVDFNEFFHQGRVNERGFFRAILEELPEQVVRFYSDHSIMPRESLYVGK